MLSLTSSRTLSLLLAHSSPPFLDSCRVNLEMKLFDIFAFYGAPIVLAALFGSLTRSEIPPV